MRAWRAKLARTRAAVASKPASAASGPLISGLHYNGGRPARRAGFGATGGSQLWEEVWPRNRVKPSPSARRRWGGKRRRKARRSGERSSKLARTRAAVASKPASAASGPLISGLHYNGGRPARRAGFGATGGSQLWEEVWPRNRVKPSPSARRRWRGKRSRNARRSGEWR